MSDTDTTRELDTIQALAKVRLASEIGVGAKLTKDEAAALDRLTVTLDNRNEPTSEAPPVGGAGSSAAISSTPTEGRSDDDAKRPRRMGEPEPPGGDKGQAATAASVAPKRPSSASEHRPAHEPRAATVAAPSHETVDRGGIPGSATEVVTRAERTYQDAARYLLDTGWIRDGEDFGLWASRGVSAWRHGWFTIGSALVIQWERDGVSMLSAVGVSGGTPPPSEPPSVLTVEREPQQNLGDGGYPAASSTAPTSQPSDPLVAAHCALALLIADIPCNNGCGCEEYDYCAEDEGNRAMRAFTPLAFAEMERGTPQTAKPSAPESDLLAAAVVRAEAAERLAEDRRAFNEPLVLAVGRLEEALRAARPFVMVARVRRLIDAALAGGTPPGEPEADSGDGSAVVVEASELSGTERTP